MSTLSVNNVTEVGGAPVVTNGVLDSGSLPTIPVDKMPTGSILQVVQTALDTVFAASVSAESWQAVTGLTASITPTSTNSKILVITNVTGANGSIRGYGVGRLTRDGSPIAIASSPGSRAAATTKQAVNNLNDGDAFQLTTSYLDSPSTTSSITYGIDLQNAAGVTATMYVNRSVDDTDNLRRQRSISTITLLEVAG